MKKMRVETFNGNYELQPMTYDNMHEVIAMEYDHEIATEVTWSDEFGEKIAQGMRFYWIDGDKIPADSEAMEWVIEECMNIPTGEFEDEEDYNGYDTPYYDASLMQYMI